MHTPFDVSLSDVSLFNKNRSQPPPRLPVPPPEPPALPESPKKNPDSTTPEPAFPACPPATCASAAEYTAAVVVLCLCVLFSHNNFGSLFALATVLACGILRLHHTAQYFYTALAVTVVDGLSEPRINVLFFVVAAVTESVALSSVAAQRYRGKLPLTQPARSDKQESKRKLTFVKGHVAILALLVGTVLAKLLGHGMTIDPVVSVAVNAAACSVFVAHVLFLMI